MLAVEVWFYLYADSRYKSFYIIEEREVEISLVPRVKMSTLDILGIFVNLIFSTLRNPAILISRLLTASISPNILHLRF